MTTARRLAPVRITKHVQRCYSTNLGSLLIGQVEDALDTKRLLQRRGQVDLLFTSPPFPLVKKKKYGNKTGREYLEWLQALAPRLAALVKPTGSIVIELGNAWQPGVPEMSTLPLRALLAFQEAAGLHLCQHVICHNPARLPTPAQWVTVTRQRLKDSFTHVWWLSPSTTPKADNRKVVTPYSKQMKALLQKRGYNAGRRPSGHVISEEGFLTDHGGAIAPSMLDVEDPRAVPSSVLWYANTSWDAHYVAYCKKHGLEAHPARMRGGLVAFFLHFLTEPGDLVFDPFAGSNTTGAIAESMRRRWLSVEANCDYAEGSRGRFSDLT